MGTIQPDTTGGDSTVAAKKSGELIPIDVVSVTDDAVKPRSGFEIFFPSALLWSMMACAASFGISIVKERTAGTFMRLQLSPIRRSHILAGKGLACFVTCVVDCVALLVIGKVAFGIRVGDPINLALALIAASLGFVGVMMLISVLGKTEESVGGAGWGILMVIAMLGGAMVPSYVMPSWLQTIGVISPVKWGILAFEGAGWRNFSLAEMMLPVSILLAIAVAGYSMGAAIFSRSDR
jgi:ABC-2 type transport system permease protein